MHLKVNSNVMELKDSVVLLSLVKKLSLIEKKGIAIAVNELVIPKQQWDQFILHPSDEVIIIEAAQGG